MLGLYAKAEFEAYLVSGEDVASRQAGLLIKSRDLYKEGFDRSQDIYCGIDTTAKSLMIGSDPVEVGKKIAEEVAAVLPEEISAEMGYWDAATLAEMALISGNVGDVARFYDEAVALAPAEISGHETTFRHLKDIANSLGLADNNRKVLEEAFVHLNTKKL